MREKKGNLDIVGDSDLSGGSYEIVKITGTVNFSGDLEANEVRVVGTVNSRSALDCGKLHITGNVKLGGLIVRDHASVVGTLSSKEIRAEVFELKGEVNCENNFECADLTVQGICNVGALLGAETLTVKSRYLSKVKECGGKAIKVRHAFPVTGKIILHADTIEFDGIDLEYTEAEVVRGKNVIIGKHCRIGTVEYFDSLARHPEAQIEREVKIG